MYLSYFTGLILVALVGQITLAQSKLDITHYLCYHITVCLQVGFFSDQLATLPEATGRSLLC